MKHTPGPWHNEKHRSGYSITADIDQYIADAHEWTGGSKDCATSMANAHLIAAAPEMFDALENIIQADSARGCMTQGDFDKVLQAIKKAKGEL